MMTQGPNEMYFPNLARTHLRIVKGRLTIAFFQRIHARLKMAILNAVHPGGRGGAGG